MLVSGVESLPICSVHMPDLRIYILGLLCQPFFYGKTKEERLAKKTKEVDSQIRYMNRADRKQVCSIDKHLFHMSAEQRITQSLDRK